MKIYIKIIAILFVNIVIAQEPPVLSTTSLANAAQNLDIAKEGNYAMDTANQRNQYVGTWQYNQNGVLFQIKIEKKDKYLNEGIYNGQRVFYNYRDVVTFKYRLVKNGVTIYNNINQTSFPASAYIPIATKKGSNTYLYGGFHDATNNVVGSVSITRQNTTPAKITFNLNRYDYDLRNPHSSYDPNQPLFTVPTGSIEMVKIN